MLWGIKNIWKSLFIIHANRSFAAKLKAIHKKGENVPYVVNKLPPRRLLRLSSSVILPHFTAGFRQNVTHHWDRGKKSACHPTTSLRQRSSIYCICCLQGVLTSKHPTHIDCWCFPLISSPSLLNAISPFHWFHLRNLLFWATTPHTHTHTHTHPHTHSHNLTIWPILAPICAQVVQRRNTQPTTQRHRSEHHCRCSQEGHRWCIMCLSNKLLI